VSLVRHILEDSVRELDRRARCRRLVDADPEIRSVADESGAKFKHSFRGARANPKNPHAGGGRVADRAPIKQDVGRMVLLRTQAHSDLGHCIVLKGAVPKRDVGDVSLIDLGLKIDPTHTTGSTSSCQKRVLHNEVDNTCNRHCVPIVVGEVAGPNNNILRVAQHPCALACVNIRLVPTDVAATRDAVARCVSMMGLSAKHKSPIWRERERQSDGGSGGTYMPSPPLDIAVSPSTVIVRADVIEIAWRHSGGEELSGDPGP
jgi:hypothetical protein